MLHIMLWLGLALRKVSHHVENYITVAKFYHSLLIFLRLVSAQSYVDMGIKLLLPGYWEDQYTLSLDLYEMSASLCYMCGDTTKMNSCLDEIISHADTFEDSLNASAMLARLLTSSHEHNEAITNCLDVLATLGEEEFPPQPDLAIVQNKLSEVQQLLSPLTADRMKALPTMMNTNKLQAMKFLGMLCEISYMAAPMLLPLLSVRMMKLTLQFGFCSDSILGIFYTAFSVVSFVLVRGVYCTCPLNNSYID